MLANDLRILKEYIDKNLAKRFIRVLILPVGSLILFIPKKDKTKRLYIDY